MFANRAMNDVENTLEEIDEYEHNIDERFHQHTEITDRHIKDKFFSPASNDYNLDRPMMKRSQSNNGLNVSIMNSQNTSRRSLGFTSKRRSTSA